MHYKVYYAKEPTFTAKGSASIYKKSHVCVRTISASDLNEAFEMMQAENW